MSREAAGQEMLVTETQVLPPATTPSQGKQPVVTDSQDGWTTVGRATRARDKSTEPVIQTPSRTIDGDARRKNGFESIRIADDPYST